MLGERVQVDMTKIAPGIYQYPAVDDCTRFRVLSICSGQTAKNSVRFLEERMINEFTSPIQRIQSDRGAEFFGLEFQKAMQYYGIEFRPIRPRSPHLNSSVERSQKTDKINFHPTLELSEVGLKQGAADREPKDNQILLREWLDYATERVPQMQEERMKETPQMKDQQGRELELVLVEGDENITDPEKRSVQRPRVFYRRETEALPLIVARPKTIPAKNCFELRARFRCSNEGRLRRTTMIQNCLHLLNQMQQSPRIG